MEQPTVTSTKSGRRCTRASVRLSGREDLAGLEVADQGPLHVREVPVQETVFPQLRHVHAQLQLVREGQPAFPVLIVLRESW